MPSSHDVASRPRSRVLEIIIDSVQDLHCHPDIFCHSSSRMTDLTSLNSDTIVLISLFISDKDLCSLFRSSQSIYKFSRLPSLWKARSLVFMPALQSPAIVSVFRRDIVIDDLVPAPFDWSDRYRSARRLQPKGLLISSELLSWFDVSHLPEPAPISPSAKSDPDSDSEQGEVSDRLNIPGAFLHQFFQRLLHPNHDTLAFDNDPSAMDNPADTDEGRLEIQSAARVARDRALSLSRFIRIRSNPGALQENSQFLHGRLIAVHKLVPSSSRARKWARLHCKDPIQKLARYHRYGMFWLQIDHDDMSFRADRPFLRPSNGCLLGGVYAPVVSYFECTVLRQPMAVGIGLCDERFHSRTPGVFIGWPASPGVSYGFHGDDGLKFHNDGRGQEYSGPYGAGDTIGCGLDWLSGVIFFTKNGQYLGEAFRNVHVAPGAKWFPTVSLKHILSRQPNALNGDGPDDEATDAVLFNSGMQGIPFVYDLETHRPDTLRY